MGWIEKDNKKGFFYICFISVFKFFFLGPTLPEENVNVGDSIPQGVVLHVKCSNW